MSLLERTGRCVALHSLEQLAVPADDQADWNRMDPVALHHAAIDIAQRGVADAEFVQVLPCPAGSSSLTPSTTRPSAECRS